MKRVHLSSGKPVGIGIAVLCIAAATLLGMHVAHEDNAHPSSDSGVIDAEFVHIATTVGGRLVELPVHVNQHVHKGDLLYRLDPEPYELTVRQAEANLALARAEVENQKRLVAVKTANSIVAQDQTTRAQTNRDLAARTVERLSPLANHAYIPWQQYDQARVALHDAEVSLKQANQQSAAAQVAIGDLKSSLAAEAANQAALDHARYELRQTVVVAPTDGYVTSLQVLPGEILAPSQVLFTLIADDAWFAIANIREVNLSVIRPGDCATVYSMIDRNASIRGHVESIGWGVLSADTAGIARALPLVPREMDWVHVAQRFPVRVRLDHADPALLRLGATATVEIRHGAACR
ncbi:multidrug resistance protein MdtN [Acetobacter nitrogenifigens DSM 23921 = NBRC 105050]|uniref:Multidrug resistance protein MdtN n=1 Tax=Acetobacter nitrogenifigens DSM 23921 = NBRC 105050 TaxID=1120919 RepID=A0A511X7U1_9PROT|nr:multidrug transporter subunit MdtN [Acetobacter nitrogenifigens]GBQ95969.1 multidrug resistance protein MdtN [Acetobacter nitrogenifigens DSM 23921 = NBRC 105050]GEN59010.1 multidrug resistance protein MdtN [Acetobacter nitrogenifigens DSM 23921 = NBRC 105050]